MKFKFEKLIIWQKAMDFGEEINVLVDKFPAKGALTSQKLNFYIFMIFLTTS